MIGGKGVQVEFESAIVASLVFTVTNVVHMISKCPSGRGYWMCLLKVGGLFV